MKRPIFIYCLWCPIIRKIRYIGQTSQPEKRLGLHISAAKNNKYKYKVLIWLRELAAINKRPRLRVLFRVSPTDNWEVHERRIIKTALAKGWPLTNQLKGGNDFAFISPDDLTRTKLARTLGMQNQATKTRKSKSAKSFWANPTIRSKIIAKQKLAASKPERRAALSVAASRRTPEGEARRIAAVKKYWADPINKERLAKRAAQRNKQFGHF